MIKEFDVYNKFTQTEEKITTEYINVSNSFGELLLPRDYVPRQFGGNVEDIEGDVGNLAANRLLSKQIIAHGVKHLQANSVVIDVGAHMGTMSMMYSKFLGIKGGGEIIAIEASPQNFVCVKHNIELNSPPNVKVTCMNAICYSQASEGTKMMFPVHDKTTEKLTGQYGITNSLESQQVHKVPVITIDSLNLSNVSLIKIDAEGADLHVLKGAQKTIQKFKPAIIIELIGDGQNYLAGLRGPEIKQMIAERPKGDRDSIEEVFKVFNQIMPKGWKGQNIHNHHEAIFYWEE